MELAKKSLLAQLNQGLIAFCVLLVLALIILVLVVILYIRKYKLMQKWIRIATPIALAFYIALTATIGVLAVRYAKDLKYIRHQEFLQIEGTLIGYAKSSSTDELTVHHSWPIFKDDATQKNLSLSVLNSEQRLEIGEHYVVIYLPNTKLAEIVE